MRPIPTMQEILGRLQEYGISAERKSIYDDMEVLRSFGMDIKFKRGKSTGYYVTGQKAATEALADGVREERFQTAAVEIPEAADAARDASGTEELQTGLASPIFRFGG